MSPPSITGTDEVITVHQKFWVVSTPHFVFFEPTRISRKKELTRLFVGGVLLRPLDLLGGAQVVLLGELEVPQKLWVHPLHLVLLLAGGLAGGVPVRLPALVVRGVVLRLGHVGLSPSQWVWNII